VIWVKQAKLVSLKWQIVFINSSNYLLKQCGSPKTFNILDFKKFKYCFILEASYLFPNTNIYIYVSLNLSKFKLLFSILTFLM